MKSINWAKWLFGGIGILLIAAAATLFVLWLLGTLVGHKPAVSTNSTTASSKDIIKAVNTPGAISALSAYKQQSAADGASYSVVVRKDNARYSVAVPTASGTSYLVKDGSTAASAATIQEQVKAYLAKTYNMAQSDAQPMTSLYHNDASTCYLMISEQGKASVTLSCVDTQQVSTEYDAIEKLLTLYQQNSASGGVVPGFDVAQRTVTTRDSMSAAVLSLAPITPSEKTQAHILLFAAKNDAWEYVADLSGGQNTGRYALTDTARAAINNPKWNGFLSSIIRG